jgi:hypothetical protein
LAATVVVPTTGDRGPLLPYSVGSALAQTVDDLEVLVIGDGVDDATRAAVERLAAEDRRVRFFPFPKDRARRGEPYRHQVLSDEAQGRIVAYLCDRDLWLPNHLAELDRVLTDADFGHTLRFGIDEQDCVRVEPALDLRHPGDRAMAHYSTNVLPLSMAGHTLAMYRRLPHGWRTTPPDVPTDRYMWAQFLAEPGCRVASTGLPTVLWFKRGSHPGLPTAQRREILERWTARMAEPGFEEELHRSVLDAMAAGASDLFRRVRALEEPALGRATRRVLPAPVYRKVRRPARAVRRWYRSVRPGA